MSADLRFVLEVIPSGPGLVLDLGGGSGQLRRPLESLAYQYINLDIRVFGHGEPSVVADAHNLPFGNAQFDLVISKDTLAAFHAALGGCDGCSSSFKARGPVRDMGAIYTSLSRR